MIEARSFLDAARARGIDLVTGVPCSLLTPLIDAAAGDPALGWVVATSEGEAAAIAAGAWFAGRLPMLVMQNSGLGNAVNPLTSLHWPFRIPTLLVVSRRGAPGVADEPQHELMGAITPDLLDLLRIAHEPFPTTADAVAPALDRAIAHMSDHRLPFAFVLGKGDLAASPLAEPTPVSHPPITVLDPGGSGPRPTRIEAMARALDILDEATAVVATTGFCGRELFTLGDRERFLYVVGSMGGASAIGLGVALSLDRPVAVFDGDGAALMKLGNLATIGARRPRRFVHVIFDNQAHVSTGGQRTVSPTVDFATIAAACGYGFAARSRDLDGFAAALRRAVAAEGPALVHAKVRPSGVDGLGRPTIGPLEVADRFRRFLAGGRP